MSMLLFTRIYKYFDMLSRGSLCAVTFCTVLVLSSSGIAQEIYTDLPERSLDQAKGTRVQESSQVKARVSLSVADSTALYVIGEIVRQTGVRIIYDKSNKALAKRVSVELKESAPFEALQSILPGIGMAAKWAPDGETIVLGEASQLPQKGDSSKVVPRGSINGRVIDSASQDGISNVVVAVVGSTVRASTNNKGFFAVRNLPPGTYTLIFSVLGYSQQQLQEIEVQDGPVGNVTVRMSPSAALLGGVVTTATGVQRKIEVGNSITTLNVDSIMKVAPITSVVDLLENRVPGMTVQRTSGQPGDPSRVRLRGAGSIYQNNDPILIVDGVRVYAAQSDRRNQNNTQGGVRDEEVVTAYGAPSPLDQIDPHVIETIEVLKGPSASSLYGSDAANGVIVITTKRGASGPPRWNVSGSLGTEYLPGKWPNTLFRFGTGLAGGSPRLCLITDLTCEMDSLVLFQALNHPYTTPLARGGRYELSTSVTGGVPTMQYVITASLGDQVGLFKMPEIDKDRYRLLHGVNPPSWMRRPDKYTTWSIMGQVAIEITQKAGITFNSRLFDSDQKRSSLGFGAISGRQGLYIDVDNPGLRLPHYLTRIQSKSLNSTNTAHIRWQPTTWLPLNATVGIDSRDRGDQSSQRNGVAELNNNGYFGSGKNSTLSRTATLNSTVALSRLFDLSIGANYVNERTEDFLVRIDSLPPGTDVPTSFRDGLTSRHSGQRTTFGWFLEPKLKLQSRFFVVPGFRLDHNGIAGRNAGLLRLPKMNFSWIASEESFFPFQDFIRLFRVRGAVGYAGVQPSATAKLRMIRMAETEAYWGDFLGGAEYAGLSTLGNSRLRPERSAEFEGGFDVEMLNGRMNLEFTQFRKTRYDAIINNIPLAPSISFSGATPTITANIGVIRNTGTEISLGVQLIERREIGWHVGVDMGRVDNSVVKLHDDVSYIQMDGGSGSAGCSSLGACAGYEVRIAPGYPLLGRWARPIQSFSDVNGDGIIQLSEIIIGDSMVYLGQQDPTYQLSTRSGLTLFSGRVDINASIAYEHGRTQFDQATSSSASSSSMSLSPWLSAMNNPDAPLSQQAAFVAASSGETVYGMIQNVNALRFQTFSVSYRLGERITRLIRSRHATIAIQGRNLGLRTNYRGMDPNVNSSVTGNMTHDAGRLPQPRVWTLRMTMGN